MHGGGGARAPRRGDHRLEMHVNMKTRFRQRLAGALAAAALVLLAGVPAGAQTVTVKMATMVPEGSSWHLILKQAAADWKKASNGRVNVVFFAGGVAGDDTDVVRKMKMGTLQGAVLTAVGVAAIEKSVYALEVPMMYSSYDEVYAVLEKMRPRLEAAMEKKGFVVLTWADAGWLHFFSKNPVRTPDDLKRQKLFQWAGDNDSLEIMKGAGFNVVPLPATELATGLQTGLVNALSTTPQVAVLSQYYNYAKNMTDMDWALLLGATVIKKDVWDRIPADLHAPLLKIMRDAGAKLQAEIRNGGQTSVEAMRKRGLNVVPVDPKTREAWVKVVEGAYPKIKGTIVPADAFDEAMRYRDEYRKRSGARK
jgi:TRAP-type C4-dicarboxylate transport system substrate-binding protein